MQKLKNWIETSCVIFKQRDFILHEQQFVNTQIESDWSIFKITEFCLHLLISKLRNYAGPSFWVDKSYLKMPKMSKRKFQKKWQEAELKVQKFKIKLNELEKDNEVVNIQMHEMHMELLETISDLKEEVKEL